MEAEPRNRLSPHHFQLILEDYKALKTEIQRRSRDQLQCVQYSLVAIGGIVSVFVSKPSEFAFLLLIIPWIISIFGIIWCDNHDVIYRIGFYIRKIESKIVEDANFLKGWETYHNETYRKKPKKYLNIDRLNIALPIFYFFIPSIMSISYFISLNLKSLIPFKLIPITLIYYSTILLDVFLIFIFLKSWFKSFILTDKK